jgi:hypothetical protein
VQGMPVREPTCVTVCGLCYTGAAALARCCNIFLMLPLLTLLLLTSVMLQGQLHTCTPAPPPLRSCHPQRQQLLWLAPLPTSNHRPHRSRHGIRKLDTPASLNHQAHYSLYPQQQLHTAGWTWFETLSVWGPAAR